MELAEFVRAEANETFELSVCLGAKFSALVELEDVFQACASENWDGEGAEPISREAYWEASRIIRLLPISFPIPEIVPEPNGQIGLEWSTGRGKVFVVAVGGNQVLTYGGLFGDGSRTGGTEPFQDALPQTIVSHLERLLRG
jgi:hypothetical protein